MTPTPRKRGRAGQADRLRRLKRSNGLCQHCLERGLTRVATRVDHVVPLAKGGADEDANTRNLCEPCHAAATAAQFGFARDKTLGACGADGRPTDPRHPWNRTRP